jgi:hypothetical protein
LWWIGDGAVKVQVKLFAFILSCADANLRCVLLKNIALKSADMLAAAKALRDR